VGIAGRVLRVIQYLFPLTSFGLILEGTLGVPGEPGHGAP
jgi:hypothetical protein